jgi:hypothetical protein
MVEVSGNMLLFFGIGVELSDTPAASLSQQSTIGTLPDDVLLEIFKSYLEEPFRYAWCTLAKVCQRWRHVIAASPRYLDLQIICTTGDPVRDLMSEWPALPIAILHSGELYRPGVEIMDNIIAALKHNNRVFEIKLSDVPSWQLERLVAAMQEPFPELTSLVISAAENDFLFRMPPPFPDSFLGGSAPRLKSLHLDGIPFPGLPKLLLSSHNLVDIYLWDIPSSVYFTPEEMATCLSPLQHLKSLKLKFYAMDSPSLAAGQHPPSLTRVVLPALTSLQFYCASEFLEGLVSRLDAPSLEMMDIQFPRSNGPVSNLSELPRFISRIEAFETFDQADINLLYEDIQFVFSPQTSSVASAELVLIFVPMTPRFLDDLTPVVCSFLPPLSRSKRLTLRDYRYPCPWVPNLWDGDIGNTPMQEILYSSTAVTDIFISEYMATSASRCMEGLSKERTIAMVPALQNIFVAELQSQTERTHGAIQEFIVAKGLAGHPVTLYPWEVDRAQGR